MGKRPGECGVYGPPGNSDQVGATVQSITQATEARHANGQIRARE